MIKILNAKISIRFLCRYFSVSPNSYYIWRKHNICKKFETKEKIKNIIKAIFISSNKTYGSPRIHHELFSQGITNSKNTVAKYMAEMKLDARIKKKYRVKTTVSNHQDPKAPRLLKVEVEHTLPKSQREVLAGDITYLKLGSKFIYLAIVMDLYNREVVRWSMGESLETGLVLRALDSAMRKVGPDAEVIFHSVRGSQYASVTYRNFLKNKNITPSMSRRGNCYDNAYLKSCFLLLLSIVLTGVFIQQKQNLEF